MKKNNRLGIMKCFLYGGCIILCIALMAVRLQSDSAKAKVLTCNDLNNSVELSYTIDATVQNAPATDVYVYNQEDISGDIVIPEYFTDAYGTHYVTSIADSTVAGADSFFVKSSLSGLISLDLSNCSKLERINDYAFYKKTRVDTITLPCSIRSFGNNVCSTCPDTIIKLPSPNVAFVDNNGAAAVYDGNVKFVAPSQSTAKEFTEGANYTSNGVTTCKLTLGSGSTVLKDFVYVLDTGANDSVDAATKTALAKAAKVTVPTKDYHDFNGYYTSLKENSTTGQGSPYIGADGLVCDNVSITADMTLQAGFSPCVYTITYDGDLTEEETKTLPTSYTYGVGVNLAKLSRTGYIWGSWYTDADFQGDSLSVVSTTAHGNMTLYPMWTPIQYTLSFLGNQNTAGSMQPQNAKYDTDVTLDACTLTRTGYQFDGWNTQADGKGTAYADKAKVRNLTTTNGDVVTLYAQWKPLSVNYRVQYIYKGLDGEEDETVTETLQALTDSTVSPDPAVKAKDGFVTPGIQKVTVAGNGNTMITYTYTRCKYLVSAVKGTGVAGVSGAGTYAYGSTVTLTAAAANGYSLDGWEVKEGTVTGKGLSSSTSTYTFTLGAGNVTIECVAKPNTYGISYTLAIGTDAAFVSDDYPTSYTYGDTVTLPTAEDVQRTGYAFAGWYDNEQYQGDAVTKIAKTDYGYKNFYARWTIETYQIHYETNGGLLSGSQNTTYTYGKEVLLPTSVQVSRGGYAFAGWYDNKDFTGEAYEYIPLESVGDKTFYAKWSPRTYTIRFETDGGSIDGKTKTEYATGEAVTLPDADSVLKAGFYFAGWYTDSYCTGDPVTKIASGDYGNKVFYASWSTRPYSITYDTKGGTILSGKVDTYEYGTSVTLPVNVARTGYSFMGWWNGSSMVKTISKTDYGNKSFVAFWQDNSTTDVKVTDMDAGSVRVSEADSVTVTDSTTKEGGYYYNLLSSKAKTVYTALYNTYHIDTAKGKEQYRNCIALSSKASFTEDDVADAQTALIWDHPDIFWVRYFCNSTVEQTDGTYVCMVAPVDAYSETLYLADLEQYESYLTQAIRNIAIKNSDSDYDKLKKIHDYVLAAYSYDNYGVTMNKATSNDTRSAGRMLYTKQGCCEAYAKVTKLFCDYYDIPCILVKSSTHMWNEVKLDGAWYGVDNTWDDDGKNRNLYFLKGAKAFSDSDHTATNNFYVKEDGTAVTEYGCFKAPALGNDYSASSSQGTTGGSKTDTPSKTTTKTGVKKGGTYTVKGLKYKVLSVSGKTASVQVSGPTSKKRTSVTIPATVSIRGTSCKVTAVGAKAFRSCKKLKKVTIGKNVTKIGNSAFEKDTKLTRLTIKSTVLKSVGKKALKGIAKKALVKAPKRQLKKYRRLLTAKTGWKKTMKVK